MIAKGNVEIWLGELLKEQMKSLHGVIRDAFRTIFVPEFELMGFLNGFQAQVSITTRNWFILTLELEQSNMNW